MSKTPSTGTPARMVSQTLGISGERSGKSEYLTLSFSPLSAPLRSRWRNNGLSADFLGDYISTFLPTEGDAGVTEGWQSQIRHAVIYIANELLENAMKYHNREVDIPIGIHLELTGNRVIVSASNGANSVQAASYAGFVQHLLEDLKEKDPGDLIFSQQETSAQGDAGASCLGLLTMISDYGAELGWSFQVEPEQPENVTITTSAVLALDQTERVAA